MVTPQAKTDEGLFKVHRIDEIYLLEIPDSLLGADILVVNRLAKAAAEVRAAMAGYAGDLIGEHVVRFEKGPGNRIFLRSISFNEMSKGSSSNGLYRLVLNSYVQPIIAAFDVKAYATDSIKGTAGSVIDLWFGHERLPDDPRCQNEDLGDNAMKAGAYGIKNLKRILPNLLQWTREENEDFGNAGTLKNVQCSKG